MNETLQTIATRFSCRAYTDEMPSDEALHAIATAGLQSPSSMNLQPWQIILVKNQALIRDLENEAMSHLANNAQFKEIYERILTRNNGKLFYGAPCLYVVAIEANSERAPLDCGIVCQSMALAASSLGLGSVICGLFQFALAGGRAEEFTARLGFREGYTLGMTILAGCPAMQAAPHPLNMDKFSVVD